MDWVWYDKPFYLMPDDPVGEEAYCVIRDAMRSSGTIGVSRLVLYRRERAVILSPRDKGIVLWTLRYGGEVRDPRDIFSGLGDREVDPDFLGLIGKVIEGRKAPWSPDMVHDPVSEKLAELINEKKKGLPPKAASKAAPADPSSNVVNIMDALRRSIAAEAQTKKPPPKSPPKR